MEQTLLLVSVVVALFVIFTKSGQKVVKDVSKSVSSLTKNSKSGFPVVLVIVIVLGGLMCLSRKKLIEGADPKDSTTVDAAKKVSAAAERAGKAAADVAAETVAKDNDYSKCKLPFMGPFCEDKLLLGESGIPIWKNFKGIIEKNGSNWASTGCPLTPPTSLEQVKSIQLSSTSRKPVPDRPYTCNDHLDTNSQFSDNFTVNDKTLIYMLGTQKYDK